FPADSCETAGVSGISLRFRRLFQSAGQIVHVLLTRSPLVYSRRSLTARLACVKHAASVRPEPGSNSPLKTGDRIPDNFCLIPDKLFADKFVLTNNCRNCP